jgi:hypothetical protein
MHAFWSIQFARLHRDQFEILSLKDTLVYTERSEGGTMKHVTDHEFSSFYSGPYRKPMLGLAPALLLCIANKNWHEPYARITPKEEKIG